MSSNIETHKIYRTYNGLNCPDVIQSYHWYIVPKAGRTSLLYWLNQNKCLNPAFKVWKSQPKKFRVHLPPWVLDPDKTKDSEKLDKLDTLFTFAFVRNPFDRLVSTFFNKVIDIREEERLEFYEQFKDNTFEEFAHIVCDNININFKGTEVHIKSQHSLMPDQIDFLGRFENYNNDTEKVCQIIANKSFDKRQGNRSIHKHYTTYYKSQELKDKVYNKYIEDFKRFNYEF